MSEANTTRTSAQQRKRPTRQQIQFGERKRREGYDHSLDKRLAVDEEALDFDNYTYRFFNDEPGRIAKFTNKDDWAVVGSDEVGGAATQHFIGYAPSGEPLFARLCKKPKIWHNQDQTAKIAKSREEEQELLRRVPTAAGGLAEDGKGYTTPQTNRIRGGVARLDGPSDEGAMRAADDTEA